MRASTRSRARRRWNTRRCSRAASAIMSGSSARTCSRFSRSSAAAPTIKWSASRAPRSSAASSPRPPAIMLRASLSPPSGSVRALGAAIVLRGDTYDEAYAYARKLAARRRLAFVHPYDDPEVIAGQGTIGLEILKQHPGDLDAIFVPVGGGGLIAGIAAYVKQIRPSVKIIGVEPEDAGAVHRSLERGRRVKLDHVGIFADGVAVRQVGRETLRLCRRWVDRIVIVTNDEICAAMKEDRTGVV